MLTSDFDYHLPAELIAQAPLAERSASRLLYLPAAQPAPVDGEFKQLLDWLKPGDLLVLNNTRVFPARLFGAKASGGKVEVLIERLLDHGAVLAHVRASKSPKADTVLQFSDGVEATVQGREDELFVLQFSCGEQLLAYLQQAGHMPLPPYITREDTAEDSSRYQTVFAQTTGAVAAPTAGLHFDDALLAALAEHGVEQAFVTLHVGAGTFQPVRAEHIADHHMHAEQVEVTAALCECVRATQARGGRIVAVGTTVVRSLESAASSGQLQPFTGDTDLFITPGFDFKVVDLMVTNFHLPKSSLLMLVSAFAGYERIKAAYAHAVAQRYRFFSYGDAMLLERYTAT